MSHDRLGTAVTPLSEAADLVLRGARLPVYGTRAGPGCPTGYFLVGPLAWICAEGVAPSQAPPVAVPPTASNASIANPAGLM